MAVYGPNGGNVPFTGFSPTLGVDAITPVVAGNVQFNGMTQRDNDLSSLLFKRANRVTRRLLQALIGAASGGTATETYTRVQAVQALNSITTQGGLIPMEVVTQINRATTATDITNVTDAITRSPITTFPADVSGNGSGNGLGGTGVAF